MNALRSAGIFTAFFPFRAFFRRFPKKPPQSLVIYIKFFIKGFYKKLFTLSTEFSTGLFPKVYRFLRLSFGLEKICIHTPAIRLLVV